SVNPEIKEHSHFQVISVKVRQQFKLIGILRIIDHFGVVIFFIISFFASALKSFFNAAPLSGLKIYMRIVNTPGGEVFGFRPDYTTVCSQTGMLFKIRKKLKAGDGLP